MDEDLTKSVWDDDFDSNKQNDIELSGGLGDGISSLSTAFGQSITPLVNEFQSYSIDDPFANPFDDRKPLPEPSDNDDDDNVNKAQKFTNFNSEQEQLHELKSEERKELKSQIMSELTHGSEESDLLAQQLNERTPKSVRKTDELFQTRFSG